MAPVTRAQRREDHAQHRRLQKYLEPLQRAHARTPRSLHALEQALVDWGVPETRAPAVQGRLQAAGTLMGQILGLMGPTQCGGRTDHELTRVRGGRRTCPPSSWVPCPRSSGCGRCRTAGKSAG